MDLRNVFSAENFLSNKLGDVFCFGFGQFPLAAREIQNEADTWHCANFISHLVTKENLPKIILCGPDFLFYLV